MAEYKFVGIDLGTSYIKGSILDQDGTHLITVKTKAPPILTPEPGWTEIDPFAYYFVFRRFLRKLLKNIQETKIYIGFSAMAPIFIPVDNECYPLYHGILYNDIRAKKEIDELNKMVADLVLTENGNPINNQQWLPKIIWFRKNYPNLYEKTWKFLELTSFILCKLTKQVVTDKTMLQEEGLLNYKKREISDKILAVLNIEREKIPKPLELEDTIEPFHLDDKEFIINAGTIDFIGSSVSLNMLDTKKLAIILGSTGIISYSTDDPKIDNRLYLDLGPLPGLYYVNGATAAAGIFVDFIMKLVGMKGKYKIVDKMLSENKIKTEGLVMLPYILGERTPIFDPYAKSVIFGITNIHDRLSFIKAAIESIGFSIKHHYDILQKLGYYSENIYLTGGLSNMGIVQKLLPSILNSSIIKVEEGDEAIGDARIAMVASKKYTWSDIKKMSEKAFYGSLLMPEPNIYLSKNYQIYREIYERLKDLFLI